MHNAFHVSLLELDTTRKGWVNKLIKPKPELDTSKNKKYKMKALKYNAIFTSKIVRDQLPRLYDFVSWKGYSEVKNT